MDFDKWLEIFEEELSIYAAESGADREMGYDSEAFSESEYNKWLLGRSVLNTCQDCGHFLYKSFCNKEKPCERYRPWTRDDID